MHVRNGQEQDGALHKLNSAKSETPHRLRGLLWKLWSGRNKQEEVQKVGFASLWC